MTFCSSILFSKKEEEEENGSRGTNGQQQPLLYLSNWWNSLSGKKTHKNEQNYTINKMPRRASPLPIKVDWQNSCWKLCTEILQKCSKLYIFYWNHGRKHPFPFLLLPVWSHGPKWNPANIDPQTHLLLPRGHLLGLIQRIRRYVATTKGCQIRYFKHPQL